MSEKSEKVTKEYVLEKFVDLMDSDAPWNTKVRGLELLGKYLNMFADQKKVDVTISSLIAGASLEQLEKLAGEGRELGSNPREHYLGMHSTDGCRSGLQPDTGHETVGKGKCSQDRGASEAACDPQ